MSELGVAEQRSQAVLAAAISPETVAWHDTEKQAGAQAAWAGMACPYERRQPSKQRPRLVPVRSGGRPSVSSWLPAIIAI